uniref:C-type lectin domain-containing protein n=1 Tax=Panagrolaimus sp. ES5 TaxID=591445 RepID=A0AC34FUE3_9BILA
TEAPLNSLASPNFGFVSNDPQLYSKLTIAFTKVNCVCPKLTYQFQTDSTVFGDCIQGFNGQTPPDIAQLMCEMSDGILVSVTSQEKLDFIRTQVVKNVFGANPEFTIGLHRSPSNAKKWFWFGYNSTSFPLGDFKKWEDGKAPSPTASCGYATQFTIGLHRSPSNANKWFWFGYNSTSFPLGDFKKWEDGKAPSPTASCGYATREVSDNALAFAAGGCDYEDARPYLCQTKACDSSHFCDLETGVKAANAHLKFQAEMKQRSFRSSNKRVY